MDATLNSAIQCWWICQTVAEAVKMVQDLVCYHAGYEFEKIRALEFMLFVRGKQNEK